jgi:predicted dehydrogenase
VVWKNVERAQLVAVADDDEAGLAAAAKRLGISRTYADYREMLAKERPQIVSIAPRWPDCHREMMLACAEAGCHVFIEKPMCRSLDEADEMVAAFAKRGLKAAMAHQTHYGPALDKALQVIADGKVGDIVEMRGRGKEEVTRGGGEDMIVLGPHVMELMRVLAGGDPQWCSARVLLAGKPVTKADVREGPQGLGLMAGDEIHASYRFPKMAGKMPISNEPGAVGYFSTRKSQHGAGARYGVQVFGTKGVLAIMGMGAGATVSLLESETWVPAPNGPQWSIVYSSTESELAKEAMGNRLIAEDLIHAIETDTKPKCDATDGRWTIEMIVAAYESHRLNQPVELPLKNRKHPLAML